jgi:hypothetical protein
VGAAFPRSGSCKATNSPPLQSPPVRSAKHSPYVSSPSDLNAPKAARHQPSLSRILMENLRFHKPKTSRLHFPPNLQASRQIIQAQTVTQGKSQPSLSGKLRPSPQQSASRPWPHACKACLNITSHIRHATFGLSLPDSPSNESQK